MSLVSFLENHTFTGKTIKARRENPKIAQENGPAILDIGTSLVLDTMLTCYILGTPSLVYATYFTS